VKNKNQILKWGVGNITNTLLNIMIKIVEVDIKQLQKEDDNFIFIKANKQMIENLKSSVNFIDAKNPYKKR
jgi:nicotinic acid phosphoribosyltransferase